MSNWVLRWYQNCCEVGFKGAVSSIGKMDCVGSRGHVPIRKSTAELGLGGPRKGNGAGWGSAVPGGAMGAMNGDMSVFGK